MKQAMLVQRGYDNCDVLWICNLKARQPLFNYTNPFGVCRYKGPGSLLALLRDRHYLPTCLRRNVFKNCGQSSQSALPQIWLAERRVDPMTREKLIEENKTLREALQSIADQIDDVLDEVEESLSEGEV